MNAPKKNVMNSIKKTLMCYFVCLVEHHQRSTLYNKEKKSCFAHEKIVYLSEKERRK
jgi:hypothetical protein